MTDPLLSTGTRHTPQSRPADERQKRNSAGGFTFTLDDVQRLRRFLTLGVDGGTYYVEARDLALDNAQVVMTMARENPGQLIAETVRYSLTGRAPRQQPILFALAVAGAHGDAEHRRAALDALPRVARTGTHVLTFVKYAEQFRGWGRVLKRGVGDWYLRDDLDNLALQVVKYRQREGWTHRDLLRLASPKTDQPARRALFNWICNGDVATSRAPGSGVRDVGATSADLPRLVEGFRRASVERNPRALATLISEYGLTWEMLPTDALNQVVVWEALLERGVPQTALMRQLPRLTNIGLLPNTGGWTSRVVAQLTDAERLRRARVHPIQVLLAHLTYANGRGFRSNTTWTPTRAVVDGLDAAFYAAFGAVRKTGKRTRLALDVSGSMTQAISGTPISARDATAALALVTANVEDEYDVVGFCNRLRDLTISPRQRLHDAIRVVSGLPFGSTDCAQPMLDAWRRNLAFDTFVVYTDNETWSGHVHPYQALRDYREHTGIAARLIVVGMTATRFTIADPSDAGMLDVAGFDGALPNLIADFSTGDL